MTLKGDEAEYKFILIGTSGTVWFVFNPENRTWEVKDRIAIEEIYESFVRLQSLVKSVIARIKEADNIK